MFKRLIGNLLNPLQVCKILMQPAQGMLNKAGVIFFLCMCLSVCLSVHPSKSWRTSDQKLV